MDSDTVVGEVWVDQTWAGVKEVRFSRLDKPTRDLIENGERYEQMRLAFDTLTDAYVARGEQFDAFRAAADALAKEAAELERSSHIGIALALDRYRELTR